MKENRREDDRNRRPGPHQKVTHRFIRRLPVSGDCNAEDGSTADKQTRHPESGGKISVNGYGIMSIPDFLKQQVHQRQRACGKNPAEHNDPPARPVAHVRSRKGQHRSENPSAAKACRRMIRQVQHVISKADAHPCWNKTGHTAPGHSQQQIHREVSTIITNIVGRPQRKDEEQQAERNNGSQRQTLCRRQSACHRRRFCLQKQTVPPRPAD